jgi:hypothetical protein
MDNRKSFVVELGAKVRLSKIDASYTGKHTRAKFFNDFFACETRRQPSSAFGDRTSHN